MEINQLDPQKALNPAYKKFIPLKNDIDAFSIKLEECINTINLIDVKNESEEHLKSPIKKFLSSTFYQDNEINTKEKIDLAIYLGKDANSDVGVLLEAKKPSNKAEFPSINQLNKKAFQEILLYYLRERIDYKNNNIKHLVITNGFEWFFFKSEDFYDLFYKNKALIKEYEQFRDKLKDTSKNELFYNEIARKYIAEVENTIPFVHLNFRNKNIRDIKDKEIINIYKLFSDVHLLGKSFGNDSNQLNTTFYKELLHIIGLEEKENGKKIIYRKKDQERDYSSLLENTIFTLEDKDHLAKVKNIPNDDQKSFTVGLELCLTWVNRILFLKLLESQLLSYNANSIEYKFLNFEFLNGFDSLNDLFFSALAKPLNVRHEKHREKFKNIPYLNSSLFERNELEDLTFDITALKDEQMEVYSGTILKDSNGKKLSSKLNTLEYLFKFLDAYDFSTESGINLEEKQENKTLINASVLGLIFEKINGYKDGSFYTPGFITMFMCKETLRKTVIQKFKQGANDSIETFEDVKNYCQKFFKKDDVKKFNELVNTIRICDPAVGSGHFLVSALNEMIAIKSELQILADKNYNILPCEIQIENDELYICDANGELFDYHRKDPNSLRIQKAIFHEKETIIENCLFGVDINPNSVNICRLRLWIELLKNAYYTDEGELQTLPNIDINIKCGNTLISRFLLNDSLKSAFKNKDVTFSIEDYKNAVKEYKTTNSKIKKKEIEEIISTIKNNFKTTFDNKFKEKVSKTFGAYQNEEQRQQNLLIFGENIKKAEKDQLKKLKQKAGQAQKEKEEILDNIIYRNAFEWRFEFPEVLDDDGNFIGFDVIIGNPPYIKEYEGKEMFDGLRTMETYQGKIDMWYLFGELGNKILKNNGLLTFIAPNNWVTNAGASKFRNYLLSNMKLNSLIDFSSYFIFDSASIQTMVFELEKKIEYQYTFNYRKINISKPTILDVNELLAKLDNGNNIYLNPLISVPNLIDKTLTFSNDNVNELLRKVELKGAFKLTDDEVANGIHPHYDFVNKKIKAKHPELKIGQGIFGLSEEDKEKINFSDIELKLIKPYYTSEQISKYYANPMNKLWIIYTDSTFKKPDSIEPYPNIKKHLDQFKNTITSDNKPYGLHRARKEGFFIGEKIITLRKCPNEPQFTYTDFDCYVSATFYVIKTNRINQKYLVSYLNSKTVKFWLKNKGKMQGSNYQLDKEPLVNIPIVTSDYEVEIIQLFDMIKNVQKETSEMKIITDKIDLLLYKTFGFSDEEISLIESHLVK